MLFHHVAPAGSPIGAADLLRWTRARWTLTEPRATLARSIEGRFGIRHASITSTGRAGLTVLLRALRRLAPHADEVLLPAYTCYSVPASAVLAGLKVRIVDVVPERFDFAPASLASADTSRVLALVVTNLYGLPGNLPALAAFARARGIFLIDDAAQAMGATVDGRPSGTWGDAGLFSLDKGKNVAAIDGGVIVTGRDDVAALVQEDVDALDEPSWAARMTHVAKAVMYAALLPPSRYWIPNAIPQLGLGQTRYTTQYPVALADPGLAALGVVMLSHLEAFTAARRANAARLREVLAPLAGLTVPRVEAGVEPAWLRFPVLAADTARRDALLTALVAAGIGATGSYPSAIADIPELQPHLAAPPDTEGGRAIAARILTLPTHPLVAARDIAAIATIFAGQSGPPAPVPAAVAP
jgi:perosamine synthetase